MFSWWILLKLSRTIFIITTPSSHQIFQHLFVFVMLLLFFSWVWNTFFCANVWYAYLFQEHSLRHHLYRYHCFLPLDDDKCSTLDKTISTVGLFFIHSFVVDGVFTPWYSWFWLLLQFEDFHIFFLFLLFGLFFLLQFGFNSLLSFCQVHRWYFKKLSELNYLFSVLSTSQRNQTSRAGAKLLHTFVYFYIQQILLNHV